MVVWSIICGLIGILSFVFGTVVPWVLKRVQAHQFREVLQDSIDGNFYIIYKASETTRDKIFPTVLGPVPRQKTATWNLTTINSCSTTRSVAYLAHEFGKRTKKVPIIKSHIETDQKVDLSFISIGGTTNPKTHDLVNNEANKFLDYEPHKILEKMSGKVLVEDGQEAGYDYAYMIKIHPSSNPKRTWICCGGIGEWGQSGAAWYLANHWKEIWKYAKDKEFAYITKTKQQFDESTTAIYKKIRQEELIM